MAKGISKSETAWVWQITESENEYVITSNADRSKYFLYKITENGAERIATGKNPLSFDSLTK